MVFNSQYIGVLATEPGTIDYSENEGTGEEDNSELPAESDSSIAENEDELTSENASETASETESQTETITETVSETEESTEELSLEAGSLTFSEWAEGFTSGNGSESSPFIIMGIPQLEFFNKNFSRYSSARYCYYELRSNIDYKGKEWTPITETVEHFNGGNYTIRNMTIVADDMMSTSYIAMFHNVTNIKNVNIIDAQIIDRRSNLKSTDSIYYAVLCGNQDQASTMEKCTVKGDITLTVENKNFRVNSLSGLVAINRGKIDNCTLEATIKDDGNVSGIACRNYGTINKCENLGEICSLTGDGIYSGIVYQNEENAEITDCRNERSIVAEGENSTVAGIVGSYNYGKITGCYNKGKLSGNTVTGIAGVLYGGSINKCHNTGDLSGENVSAIVDHANGGEIVECSNSGKIQGTKASGCIQRHWSSSKYDLKVSKCTNEGEVAGTEQAAGIIVSACVDKYNSSKLKMVSCVNEGQVSNSEDSQYGAGAAGIVYEVQGYSADSDMIVFEKCSNVGSVSSHNTAAGIANNVRGKASFVECSNEGDVLGNLAGGILQASTAYTVEAYDYEDDDEGEEVAINPSIIRCYNTGTVTNKRGSYESAAAGIACKVSSGNVIACYNSGTISGENAVAGIVATVYEFGMDTTITDCYNSGNIVNLSERSSGVKTGGIGGEFSVLQGNKITIKNCYNMGEISCKNYSNDYVGQLFGVVSTYGCDDSNYEISGCYFSKELGTCVGEDSYNEEWFADGKAYGVTTDAMKQQSTFEDYDFAETWSMGKEEYPYPILSCIGAGDGFRIIYVLNGGKNNKNNVSRFKQDDEVVLFFPTREGYDFAGWYTDYLFTEKINSIQGSIRKDITVYAKWKKGDEVIDTVTLNGTGYAYLWCTLYNDNGNVLKNTRFGWKLRDVTNPDNKVYVDTGVTTTDDKGMFSIITPKLTNYSKTESLHELYEMELYLIGDGDSEIYLGYKVIADVLVTPFSYEQLWDLGSSVGGKLGWQIGADTKKIGEATLQTKLGDFGESGSLGKRIIFSQEIVNGKKNITIKNAISTKLGMNISFGPSETLKTDENDKYKAPSGKIGAGVSCGSTITPGLTIEDYDPNDPEDVGRLGLFMVSSLAFSSGNVLLLTLSGTQYAADYLNSVDYGKTISVSENGSISGNVAEFGGIGLSGKYNENKVLKYSESFNYDKLEGKRSTSFLVDQSIDFGADTEVLGIETQAGGNFKTGDSFTISAPYSKVSNVADIDWVSLSISDTDTTSFSFVINAEKASTSKTVIKFKDKEAVKICQDVDVFRQFARDDARFVFESAQPVMMKQFNESDAVGSYKVSNISSWGKSLDIPISVPGFTVKFGYSGSYEESYDAENGIYASGESQKYSTSSASISGTSYLDIVDYIKDPFEYYYKLAKKELGEAIAYIGEKTETVIERVQGTVTVAANSVGSGAKYAVHLFTTGDEKINISEVMVASYEVMDVTSADEISIQAADTDTVFTVGYPYLVYLTDESDAVAGLEEEERMLDAFPEGDTCTLTLAYTLGELQAAGITDINEGNLNIYMYSDELEGYECIGGTRDYDNNSVTATISAPGQYILAIDDDIPVVRGIEVSDHTSTPEITVYIDENSGFGDLSLKIDDVEVVNESNYKPYYSVARGTLTYKIEAEDALADGMHTVSIFAVDTAGNGMVAPEILEFAVHNTKPEIADAKCYIENDTIRVRANFKDFGDVFDESVYLEDVARITADVTELYAPEDGEPQVAVTSFDLGSAGMERYLTGFAESQLKGSTVVKFAITITDINGNETVKEFTSDEEGKVIDHSAANDLWYYMPQSEYKYTGTAIKPVVYVFDGDKLLTEKKDYTVAYKNNTNAFTYVEGADATKRPCITVTGKGNYVQKDVIYFDISKKDITDDDVIIADIATVLSNGKPQKPVTALTWGKKKLAVNKDFTITYCKKTADVPNFEEERIIPEAVGEFFVLIEANPSGNYTGCAYKPFTIANKDTHKLISKVTVSKIKDKPYTGSEILADEELQSAKDGRNLIYGLEKSEYEKLTEDEKKAYSYVYEYFDNTNVGTAKVVLTGVGNFIGTKTVNFKITGIAITKATVSSNLMKRNDFVYDGTRHTLTDLELNYKFNKTDASAEVLSGLEKADYDKLSDADKREYHYIYEYLNNVNAGTATVIITGVNGFTGSTKKTFKIAKYTLKKNETPLVLVSLAEDSYEYTYPAVTPKPVVTYLGRILKEGRDYTLAYSNNKAVNDGSNAKKLPTVTIKPTGNFAGISLTCTYTITPAAISDDGLTATAPDKVYADKKGAWKSTATVTGTDGKKVATKGNYTTKPVYKYESFTAADGSLVASYDEVKNIKNSKQPTYETRSEGDIVDEFDVVPAGTTINIVLAGEGNYTGEIVATYRVVAYDIGKLNVTVPVAKTYTTREVRLKKSDIVIKKGKDDISNQVTYEIDESTYKNNVNKGKASVVIRGYGEYGGSKTVNYTIGTKLFIWRILK